MNQVRFQLGGIVGHIIDHVHPKVFGRAMEDGRENLTDAVENYLAIGKCHVHRTFHCRKIVLAFAGVKRGAGEFPVVDLDAVLLPGYA